MLFFMEPLGEVIRIAWEIKCPKFLLKKKLFTTLVTTGKQTLFETVTIGIGTTAVGFCNRGKFGLKFE